MGSSRKPWRGKSGVGLGGRDHQAGSGMWRGKLVRTQVMQLLKWGGWDTQRGGPRTVRAAAPSQPAARSISGHYMFQTLANHGEISSRSFPTPYTHPTPMGGQPLGRGWGFRFLLWGSQAFLCCKTSAPRLQGCIWGWQVREKRAMRESVGYPELTYPKLPHQGGQLVVSLGIHCEQN